MAEWARFRRARIGVCPHHDVVITQNAGLERIVCEACGHVSVRYVTESVKVFNDQPEARRRPVCGNCGVVALFMVPSGFACADHAWAAAARQDALGAELWIPIKIDEGSKTSG